MSRIIFDEPPWWQQARWQLAALAVLAVVALAIWWTALTPVDHGPIVVRTPTASTVVARSAPWATPVRLAPAARPAPAGPPLEADPESDDVAPPTEPTPGAVVPHARVAPLNLPPGLQQMAPEPQREDDPED